MRKTLISIIIPAYKQEKTIIKDLRRIKQILDKLRYKTELICVVDGFADKTLQKAAEFSKKNPGVRVVGYETNRGKGYAIRFGMAKARGNIIAFIDSGMDLNPNGLSMLLEHFEWYGADIVVGSKRHPVSKVIYPWQRRILSIGYQVLTGVLFGLKVKDTQVGLKFFRREVLEKVLPRLLVKTYAFDIEILAVANYTGFKRIFEAPVEIKLEFGNTSAVTGKNFYITIFRILWDTLAVFYRLKLMHYYSDKNKRRWVFDPELNFRVNIG
ncbi:glycosyltransferase [Candidatus Daviesbacteria bacterium]|nr:glycosyltransferase [Candidatus Daviesbacteria bacterium]